MRVRFAPSPSGHLHVGNVRTALFNWLLARGRRGTFVLRIEDTDAERSSPESEGWILDDLRWLGLDWDEGPDTGGPYGPYRQSERLERYAAAAGDLVARGAAYYCFCTPGMLEADRRAALEGGRPPKYGGRCRALDAAEARARVASGVPAAIRFRVPSGPDVAFDDVVRGRVTFSRDVIGDPVIVRSDGRPAYNFAVVIDDVAMRITHVVRGEDHISNTPRQCLIYDAIGAPPPVFAHLSLVLGPDHAPLSKRHGVTSVAEFRDRGYLPESLINYLALLGWSPGEGEEIVPIAEMARRFDLTKVAHSAAVFDMAKLGWVNRHYMKEASPPRIAALAMPSFVGAGFASADSPDARRYVESLLPMAVGSVDRIDEIAERVRFVFEWTAERAADLGRHEPDAAKAVSAFAREVAALGPLSKETFRAAAARARERSSLKGRALFHPIRVALTAAENGPELDMVVPAIDSGAALPPGAGVARIASTASRANDVARLLEQHPSGRS